MALYIGSMSSPPSVLPRVCVGPGYGGRVNISWHSLPCHLQNGADVYNEDYIIQYTPLSTGTRVSISSVQGECSQDVDDHYSCLVAESLIPNNQSYSFQVAAQNSYGKGSFSDPINVSVPVSSRCYDNNVH